MKRDVDRLATYLVAQGYAAKGLHGDMEQRQREEVIRAFKSDTLEVLSCYRCCSSWTRCKGCISRI